MSEDNWYHSPVIPKNTGPLKSYKIDVSEEFHARLKAFCKGAGIRMGTYVETLCNWDMNKPDKSPVSKTSLERIDYASDKLSYMLPPFWAGRAKR